MHIRTVSVIAFFCSASPLALVGCDDDTSMLDMAKGRDMSTHLDSGGDGAPAAVQFGTFVIVGFSSLADVPTTALTLTTTDIDTGNSTMCDTHNNQAARYCVVVGTTITLPSDATFSAHGTRPLVLLATSTFDLQGTIDVSSKHDALLPGAGAITDADVATACTGATAATGNSGSFGGSFGGNGGNGESIDGNGGVTAPPLVEFPTELRGGCPGGDGATTTADVTPGKGGNGGGAVAVIAAEIHMSGKINASGAGGKGGPAAKSGGGGGGSGGMIVLDTPSIVPGAGPDIWLFANGGGGGQGGTSTEGAGVDGSESPAPLTSGVGGVSAISGGEGGRGSFGTNRIGGDSAGGNASGGGGGGAGGGGAGFIRTPPIPGAVICPPPT